MGLCHSKPHFSIWRHTILCFSWCTTIFGWIYKILEAQIRTDGLLCKKGVVAIKKRFAPVLSSNFLMDGFKSVPYKGKLWCLWQKNNGGGGVTPLASRPFIREDWVTKNNSFRRVWCRLFVRISISHSGTPIIGGNISRLSLDHGGDVQNQRPNAAIFDGARPDSHQKSVVSMHCFHSLFGRENSHIKYECNCHSESIFGPTFWGQNYEWRAFLGQHLEYQFNNDQPSGRVLTHKLT